MTSLADVIVDVIDVNDEPPRFTASVFRFVVVENQPRGTEVGYVTAADEDQPPFNHFRYALMASGSSKAAVDAFQIDEMSGRIVTTRELDREEQAEYHLICVAADPTVTALSAAVPLVISVGDLNDNAPVFSTGSDVIRVSFERVMVDRVVGRVAAHDDDDGANGEVFYWAESLDNDTIDMFSIAPRSGQITLMGDVEQPVSGGSVVHTLSVTASDLGDPPTQSHALLNIIIERQSRLGQGYRVDGMAGRLVGWRWIALTVAIILVSLVVVVVLLVAICVAASTRRHQTTNDASKIGPPYKLRQSYNCRRREREAEEEAATRTALIVDGAADCCETMGSAPPAVCGDHVTLTITEPHNFDTADKIAPEADCEVSVLFIANRVVVW